MQEKIAPYFFIFLSSAQYLLHPVIFVFNVVGLHKLPPIAIQFVLILFPHIVCTLSLNNPIIIIFI